MTRAPGAIDPEILAGESHDHTVAALGPRRTQHTRRAQGERGAVAGTGVAMSIAGGLLSRQARNDHAAFARAVAACEQAICVQLPTRRRDIGERNDALGTTALITGGAILAAGLAGVLINLPRFRRSEPTRREAELDLAPLVSGDTAGLSARIQF